MSLSAGHDVTGEKRDEKGEWTAGGVPPLTDDHFNPPNGHEPGVFWRVHPKGASLHGARSTTSADEEIDGVMVFDNLNELAALDWMNEKNVELVKIAAGTGDTFHVGDQEGVGLKAGRGEIVARKAFKDVKAIKSWSQQKQMDGWGK